MKVYVFITLNLCTMHGANMYLYNKEQYLLKHGYKVYIYSAEQGEILIPGLRKYQRYQKMHLRFYPGCFRKSTVDKVLNDMISEIGISECDETVVESTNMYSALWGELLAAKLKCKHMVFILQEGFGYAPAEKDYLRFKLARHELAGITQSSVAKMLGDENLPFDGSMRIGAFCNNTVDECEDTISSQLSPTANLTIGTIGRLDKGYVMPMVRQLKDLFLSHPQRTYNLVVIGGTRSDRQQKEIRKLLQPVKNVNLIMPGALFPVPVSFVNRCDLFISAAGAAVATYYQKRPTINLNPKLGDIIGIYGLTCRIRQYELYSSNAPLTDLEKTIDLLLEKKDEIEYVDDMVNGDYQQKMDTEFARQLSLAKQTDRPEYYHTASILFTKKAYKPYNFLGKVFGAKPLYWSIVAARKALK